MGRNGHGPKWSWAEMVMGRNDPESPMCVKIDQSNDLLYVYGGIKFCYWFRSKSFLDKNR